MADSRISDKKPCDFPECNCSKCQYQDGCIHKDAYRRLPNRNRWVRSLYEFEKVINHTGERNQVPLIIGKY